MSKRIILLSFLTCFALLFGYADVFSRTKETGKKDKVDEELQRRYEQVFDLQQNSVSNIQFYITNYGIIGLDVARGTGGGFWPRGSLNQYIFGGGIWFGALKRRAADNQWQKLVEVTYNPNSGKSWMVPGRITDGDGVDNSDVNKYRTYFSTDFKKGDGTPYNSAEQYSWPIWDDEKDSVLKQNRYFGHYIQDMTSRSRSKYSKGPAFISGEDIFCTYKDTDLNRYEGGIGVRKNKGYPMRLQFEQTIYSWGFGDYRDFIFIKYDIINTSKDTLMECWMAPVLDIDIARAPNTQNGAANDRVRFYDEEDSLNLAFQWTNTDRGEKNFGFGYLGFDFLESPAVDEYGFLRKGKVFPNKEQLGLITFKNWPIAEDIQEDGARYDAMASKVRDNDKGPGDNRFMMATGKFNMLPNDTVRIVVGIVLANPTINKDGDGTTKDLAELVRKDKFMQMVYDNNFRAPQPPERSIITEWKPLNNGVEIKWDSTSEVASIDDYEKGMDFLGYKIYRARRTNLDTFDISDSKPDGTHTSGKGPYGWKEIASYEVPTPFHKSAYRSGNDPENTNYPLFDSLRIVGPWIDPNTGELDWTRIKVMRVAKGVILFGSDSLQRQWHINNPGFFGAKRQGYYPIIVGLDTYQITDPWGKYFAELYKNDASGEVTMPLLSRPLWHDPYNTQPIHNQLLDSILLGTIEIKTALLRYNPLLWKKQSFEITRSEFAALKDGYNDTTKEVTIKSSVRNTSKNDIVSYDKLIPQLDPAQYVTLMNDSNHVRQVLDSVYRYLRLGLVDLKWATEFEQSQGARQQIASYMDKITNHRTFIDIGDDNGNHKVEALEDPSKTEKLLNSIDYYYKIIAWDEGDFIQPTPSKYNDASPGLQNMVKVNPLAAPASNDLKFDIISMDTSKLGGFYNFQMFSINDDRVRQLLAGDTLELEFQPYWFLSTIQPQGSAEKSLGLYYRRIILRDITKNKELYNNISNFEAYPCNFTILEGFTENAMSYVYSDKPIIDSISGDTIKFGMYDNNERIQRTGKFTTGDWIGENFCYSYGAQPEMLGNFGFKFDYVVEQRGGEYRPDPETINGKKINGENVVTPIYGTTTATATEEVGLNIGGWAFTNNANGWSLWPAYGSNVFGSYNNGPGDYQITFKPGGEEDIAVSYEKGEKEKTFRVKYLNVEVKNTASFEVTDVTGKKINVSYPEPLQHMVLGVDTAVNNLPSITTLGIRSNDFIGKYNLSAYGWVNGRRKNGFMDRDKQFATPTTGDMQGKSETYLGTQGKYYLTAVNGTDTLDFVNYIQIGGTSWAFDFPNKGRITPNTSPYTWIPVDIASYNYNGEDFKEGDQIMLKITGGAFGLPMPGAKVRFKISESTPKLEDYTDDLMDQIKVVPNPYYITHEGEKSPYDAKIYFTKLPEKCTIDIYTINGELVVSLDHDEKLNSEPSKEALEIWNLMSKNRLRVQSQTLVAVIKTPNGATTVKEFTVVVGGSRVITAE